MKRQVGWPTRQDPSCWKTQNPGQVVINGKCQPNLETNCQKDSQWHHNSEYLKFHNELREKMKGWGKGWGMSMCKRPVNKKIKSSWTEL